MPFVTFHGLNKRIEVPEGTTLFEAAHLAGLPVASSCQADFVCGKCHMRVWAGAEHLSLQTVAEKKLLQRERAPLDSRVSCQVQVRGDCTVGTSYW